MHTIRRILDVAGRQFAAVGYATTNKTIAKPALYRAVSESVFPSMVATFREALVGAVGFRTQITRILEASIELNRHRPSLAGFVMGAPVEARRHPELRVIVDGRFGSVERLVEQLIEQARWVGELGGEVERDALVDMVLSILHGLAHLAYRGESGDRFARAVRSFERLLDGTLIAGPGPVSGRR